MRAARHMKFKFVGGSQRQHWKLVPDLATSYLTCLSSLESRAELTWFETPVSDAVRQDETGVSTPNFVSAKIY